MGQILSRTDKTREIEPQPGNSKQGARPGSGIVHSGLSMRVPYLVATAFVALTALLTLLLNVAMENKGELEKHIALQSPNPLLADARTAFGQVTAIDTFHPSVTASGNTDAGQTNKSINHKHPLVLASEAADVHSARDAITAISADTQPSEYLLPALDSGIAVPPQHNDKITAIELTSSNSRQSPTVLSQVPEQVTMATDETLPALDNIVYIRGLLSKQNDSQQELESTVMQYMTPMDKQIIELTRRVNAVEEIHRVGTAFERVLYKRQGLFERMLNRRFNILQRASESRTNLRAGYMQLL